MNLDRRVQALESRTDEGERVETIAIVGVRVGSDPEPGMVLTCNIDRDRYFTVKKEASR